MVEATLVLAIASGQSTVPKFTVSSEPPAPPPPQAPNKNIPATSKNPKSAALADLPPLFIYHAPFACLNHRRITALCSEVDRGSLAQPNAALMVSPIFLPGSSITSILRRIDAAWVNITANRYKLKQS